MAISPLFQCLLGEAEPFYEQVTIYYQNAFHLIDDNFDYLSNEPIFCFYKGFALFFDEQQTVAYHFNRQLQQATTLGKAAIINRIKLATKREQQGNLTFELTGKKVCLDNNTGWKTYWLLADKILTNEKLILTNKL